MCLHTVKPKAATNSLRTRLATCVNKSSDVCEQLETSKELYLNVFILGIKHKPPWRTLAQRNLKSTQNQRKVTQDREVIF